MALPPLHKASRHALQASSRFPVYELPFTDFCSCFVHEKSLALRHEIETRGRQGFGSARGYAKQSFGVS
jgi:hypothetical protein